MSTLSAIVLPGDPLRRRPSPFALGLQETRDLQETRGLQETRDAASLGAALELSAVVMPEPGSRSVVEEPGLRTETGPGERMGSRESPRATAAVSGRAKLTPQELDARAQQRAEDDELIRAAQKGDRSAFDSLVRRYDRSVLRLALHMLSNEEDAQDVHQEAFIKAYRHLSNFRFECSFYTWLYRIVTNLCLDQLRRRKSRREDPGTVTDGAGEEMDLMANVQDNRAGANPGRELERKTQHAAIQGALGELTPRERMVFELKHYQGLKLRTIGEMLSTTEETAKNTLFRATRKLRLRLAEVR